MARAEILGAQTRELPFGHGEPPVSDEVKGAIADVIREAKPRLAIAHWHGSIHQDHTNARLNFPNARFFAGIPAFVRSEPAHWVGQVLFAENWEDLRDFVPEVCVRVKAKDLERWERAMRRCAFSEARPPNSSNSTPTALSPERVVARRAASTPEHSPCRRKRARRSWTGSSNQRFDRNSPD